MTRVIVELIVISVVWFVFHRRLVRYNESYMDSACMRWRPAYRLESIVSRVLSTMGTRLEWRGPSSRRLLTRWRRRFRRRALFDRALAALRRCSRRRKIDAATTDQAE